MGASVLLVSDEAPEFGDKNPIISENLAKYIETAGSVALRFSNPAKYRANESGPTALLHVGAVVREIPIFENPAVDEIPIIQESQGKKDAVPSDETRTSDDLPTSDETAV